MFVAKRMRLAAVAAVMSLAALCGCEDWSWGGFDPFGGWLIDPVPYIQGATTYQQQVFENANTAWGEYFTE